MLISVRANVRTAYGNVLHADLAAPTGTPIMSVNNGTVTNFQTTTGAANYQRVLGILDPRVVRFGVRYEF